MESKDHGIIIGTRETWGQETPFGISGTDRRQHLYAIGRTGTGKTTFLQNLIVQDIEAGRGVGIIDPHGDLAATILEHIPPWRIDDVVYFNPADAEHPLAFNLLRGNGSKHVMASGIVASFKSIFRESWGPRLEYILFATVSALLDCENASLLGIQRMFTDDRYRAWVTRQIKDPAVEAFWLHEFPGYKSFLAEAVAPIQNKVGQLFMSPLARNIFGQVQKKFDVRFLMDNRRIFIANLSKGVLGEDQTNLIGSLLVTQFQLAAMSRADIPEDKRVDFFLYVDEFHNFATDSFTSILSEARKYRLCLTLAHQYMEQLKDSVRSAVFGNVGSLVSFRVGEEDASVLVREIGSAYSPSQLAGLPNHGICAKVLAEGGYGEPIFGKTLRFHAIRHGKAAKVIDRSRERYASKRAVVEERIAGWMRR